MWNISDFTNVSPQGITPGSKHPPLTDPRNNEDCLFLDVIVPTQYLCTMSLALALEGKLLSWFGLLGASLEGRQDFTRRPSWIDCADPISAPGAIYVAINYRLAGSTFTASGGTPNSGLHNQRLALHWIHKHIHVFGGDSDQVTLMGASAGAAISLHQITAYGCNKSAPFPQVFLQSPAFNPNHYPSLQEKTYQMFLQYANTTSLAELRASSSEQRRQPWLQPSRRWLHLAPTSKPNSSPVASAQRTSN